MSHSSIYVSCAICSKCADFFKNIELLCNVNKMFSADSAKCLSSVLITEHVNATPTVNQYNCHSAAVW